MESSDGGRCESKEEGGEREEFNGDGVNTM